MEKIVKFRLVNFYRPFTDPIDGTEKRAEVMASHGQRLSTEDERDDGVTLYRVPEDEIKRLENLGALFSDAEVKMMEAGVTDDLTPRESLDDAIRGDTHTSQAFSVGDPDGSVLSEAGGTGTAHPLAFGEIDQAQMEAYLQNEKPSPQELLDSLDQVEPGEKDLVARRLLAAEHAVTGGEPRSELAEGVAQRLGFGQAPEGSEGVEGTLPEDADTGGGSGGGGSSPDATDSAAEYAKEQGIDLSQVKGTGSGGRVTLQDVKDHEQTA